MHNGLNGTILDPERPLSLDRMNEPGLLGPTEFMMLSFVNGEFTFVVVVSNVGLDVVQSWRTRFGLVPDRSLTTM